MRQGVLGLGQPDEIHRMMRRDRQGQRLRIGQPDILARQDHEAARDETRVLPAGEHLRQPVHRRIRIAAAATLDEGGDRIVVLVLVGIVTNPPLAREHLELRFSDHALLGQPEREHFE